MDRVQVSSIPGFDWKVLSKKISKKVAYYILIDEVEFNIVGKDGEPIKQTVLSVAKESLDPREHFSGRIRRIEDVEKVFDSRKARNGRTEIVKVPYVHTINDFILASRKDVEEQFGEELIGFKLDCEGQPSQTLYYENPKFNKPEKVDIDSVGAPEELKQQEPEPEPEKPEKSTKKKKD